MQDTLSATDVKTDQFFINIDKCGRGKVTDDDKNVNEKKIRYMIKKLAE